ncbi:protein PTHB1-like [Oscarella lobularis]|uniref:protein PTHB1-like n=1 Tax=Oscarella lobularis TaxID=121494 RepID=UPI0033139EF1
MSLFKTREWWSTSAGSEERFGSGCLCVANVDNKPDGLDKIVVGSFSGALRIYVPKPPEYHAEDLLIEAQLQEPILQVLAGKFVSGSAALHLAVLHPRKFAVYGVSGTSSSVDHGVHYTLAMMYQHGMERTACNMTSGPFGEIKGKDFICVQSMDGFLYFFEQESFAFGRFLPNFLLPGPILYVSRTDSFVTCSSAKTVDSFKYRVLAVATDDEKKANREIESTKKPGKKVTMDWSFQLGDYGMEVHVASFESVEPSLVILGEHGLYCLSDTGSMKFMKKLEYNPSCIVPYASVAQGKINTLVTSHSLQLCVYQDVQLSWASKLNSAPVAIRVGNFQNLNGVIVTLDNQGLLNCCYLGTDPSLFVAPPVDSREINYEEGDKEMRELQKVIKETQKSLLPDLTENHKEDVQLIPVVPPCLDPEPYKPDDLEVRDDELRPSITIGVSIKSFTHKSITDVTVYTQPSLPLAVNQTIAHIDKIVSIDPSPEVKFVFFTIGALIPYKRTVGITASYTTDAGAPRVCSCTIELPLSLFCTPCSPSKAAQYKITLDTNKPPLPLAELFPEFVEGDEAPANAMGFHFQANVEVTLLASKNSQRHRLQSDRLEAMAMICEEFDRRIHQYFAEVPDFATSYTAALPLPDYFQLIESHLEARHQRQRYARLLDERAKQFRSIQKRLLTRFKDKTPAPLINLDTLLEGTYRQIMAVGEASEANDVFIKERANALAAGTKLLLHLMRLWINLSATDYQLLESLLCPEVDFLGEQGWEETVDAAVSQMLKTSLSKSAREQSVSFNSVEIPPDAGKLKKHIALLCDRLKRGGKLNLVGVPNTPIPRSEALDYVDGDEEEEEREDSVEERGRKKTEASPPPPSAESAAAAVSAVMTAAAHRKSRLSPLPELVSNQKV